MSHATEHRVYSESSGAVGVGLDGMLDGRQKTPHRGTCTRVKWFHDAHIETVNHSTLYFLVCTGRHMLLRYDVTSRCYSPHSLAQASRAYVQLSKPLVSILLYICIGSSFRFVHHLLHRGHLSSQHISHRDHTVPHTLWRFHGCNLR